MILVELLGYVLAGRIDFPVRAHWIALSLLLLLALFSQQEQLRFVASFRIGFSILVKNGVQFAVQLNIVVFACCFSPSYDLQRCFSSCVRRLSPTGTTLSQGPDITV